MVNDISNKPLERRAKLSFNTESLSHLNGKNNIEYTIDSNANIRTAG